MSYLWLGLGLIDKKHTRVQTKLFQVKMFYLDENLAKSFLLTVPMTSYVCDGSAAAGRTSKT